MELFDFIFINIVFITIMYIIYNILYINLNEPRPKPPPVPSTPVRKVYRTRLRVRKERKDQHDKLRDELIEKIHSDQKLTQDVKVEEPAKDRLSDEAKDDE